MEKRELVDGQRIVEAIDSQDQWERYVLESRHHDRYVEGLEREMANALWTVVLGHYPGLVTTTGKQPPLYMAAGGSLPWQDSWAVGEAGECIKSARICAETARQAGYIAMHDMSE